MDNKIVNRVIYEANHMIKTGMTIREIAKIFNVSKSTVHKDLNERLLYIDNNLYKEIKKIFKHHLEIRHIRGGESTKQKFFLKNAI